MVLALEYGVRIKEINICSEISLRVVKLLIDRQSKTYSESIVLVTIYPYM
jgi:hypothetical protein